MIRVLNVVSFGLGLGEGIQAAVMAYCRNINPANVQFDFLLPDIDTATTAEGGYYEAEAKSLGARIFRYPRGDFGGNWKFKLAIWLIRFMREHPEFKIVHIHHHKPGVYLEVFLMALGGVPVRIVHSHSCFLHRDNWDKQKTNQFLLRTFSTHLFACSTEAGVSMFGQKAKNNKKFRLIRNALDVELYRFNPVLRDDVRKKLGFGDKYVLINVGGLRTQKNQFFLLEAFSVAYSANPDMILLLVGDGKWREKLKEKALALGLSDCVRFLGLRTDVSDLLQSSDLFVFPSLYEGLGIAAIEAQTAGLPCLISDTVGVSKAVKVTDGVEFVPITQGPEVWAERILAYKSFERRDCLEDVRRAGYDIKDAAKKLEEFYIDAFKAKNVARSIQE